MRQKKQKEKEADFIIQSTIFYDLVVFSQPFTPTETLVNVKQPAGILIQQDL